MAEPSNRRSSSTLLCAFIALVFLATMSYPATCHPTDERLEIDLELELAEVEMPVSTQNLTELNVLGWVEMSRKPPGETIIVELAATPLGQYSVGMSVNPDKLAFFYTGTRYFNLTIWMQEDTAPGKEYLVDVVASADSMIAYDDDTFHLKITTVPDLWGKAAMLEQPPGIGPGGTTTGKVQITNTGTRYAEYRMEVLSDTDSIVEAAGFNIRPVMVPNWVEKVSFDIEVADTAVPGQYSVTMALLVVQDDGSTTTVDSFDVSITVLEPDEARAVPFLALVVASLIVIALVVAIILRRKA